MGPIEYRRRLERTQRVVLDTNLLVLWITGETSIALVDELSNTGKGNNRDDFLILQNAINCLPRNHHFFITPHIAAETWNHLEKHFKNRTLERISERFKEYSRHAKEKSSRLRSLVDDRHFLRLGIADTAQLNFRGPTTTVLTDDSRLSAALEALHRGVINFNWLRYPT